jgi:iron complex outermembrane receptor protein
LLSILAVAVNAPVVSAGNSPLSVLKGMSIDELMQVEVLTAGRREEKLFVTPAAVHVIDRDDIRRAGITSIPEALRLAPGVEVARSGAHSWSIAVRGFNSDLSNKLLVLIDGRSVYSPLFAGVFWDVQDTLLEDVERIEVVAGPGGTLWGANAVNGVINIITRSAKDTNTTYVEAGSGNEEEGFGGVRVGRSFGEELAARAYVKYFDRDASELASGGDTVDAWHMSQGGFRLDWEPAGSNSFTLQGDLYAGRESGVFRGSFTLGTLPGSSFRDHVDLSGGNLLGRWVRQLDAGGDLRLQVYYDRTRRAIPNTFTEERDTFDIDFQQRVAVTRRNDLLFGAGARWTADHVDNTLFATFTPASRQDLTLSAFVQDRIDLWDERLYLTLGSKFEHNDYTGFEVQPNARLAWLASPRQTLWAAVSRAVRIPSRIDADLRLTSPISIPGLPIPVFVNVDGTDDFDAERLLAYELGYRIQTGSNLAFDLAAFYNEYQDLQTMEPRTPLIVTTPNLFIVLPNVLENGLRGRSYGGTLSADWRPLENWRLQFHYSRLLLQLSNQPGALDPSARRRGGNSPRNQLALRSFFDFGAGFSFYTALRYVDDLPNLRVPSYTAVDAGMSARTRNNFEFSIAGQNLSDSRHLEFASAGNSQIERSFFAKVVWRY